MSEANPFFQNHFLWYDIFRIWKQTIIKFLVLLRSLFYYTDTEFESFYCKIKLHTCPHCNLIGCLILHGFLYGYDQSGDSIKRGRRIFCSNRKKRTGCGKTFSILKPDFIKNHMICASDLWAFLKRTTTGSPIIQAFKNSVSHMNISSGYRLFKKFRFCQSHIRTRLNTIKDPPIVSINNPVFQTIMHLEEVFPISPISAFQHHFQISFV